jgi:hypothetical protein
MNEMASFFAFSFLFFSFLFSTSNWGHLLNFHDNAGSKKFSSYVDIYGYFLGT